MNLDAKLIKTKDGSDTIFLSNLNEHYHSVHGAVNESEHVYLKSGLDYYLQTYPNVEKIDVLEVGMGTGLNVLLTALWDKKRTINVNFTTLEPFPLSWEMLQNYSLGKLLEIDGAVTIFEQIHIHSWNVEHLFNPNFSFTKYQKKLEDITFEKLYDLIFFDAFAPNKQEDIWCKSNLMKVFSVLNKNGVLVTYCAKGSVRRMLKEVGFTVQQIQGPLGKREMLRCLKIH